MKLKKIPILNQQLKLKPISMYVVLCVHSDTCFVFFYRRFSNKNLAQASPISPPSSGYFVGSSQTIANIKSTYITSVPKKRDSSFLYNSPYS